MARNDQDKQSAFRQARIAILALALPFVMAVGPVAGYFLGRAAGAWLGGGAWGPRLGILFGAAASVHQTVLIIRRILRETK